MTDRSRGTRASEAALEEVVVTARDSGDDCELVVRGGTFEVQGAPPLRVGAERELIGRAPGCALRLTHDTVSAVHAEVQATPTGVRLLDNRSTNGTFLGAPGAEARITDVFLTGPCVGRFGKCAFRFLPADPQTIVLADPHRFGGLVGATPKMRALFGLLARYADTSQSIVIRGETGTGKERAARAIHEASARRKKRLVAINCGAIAETLIESELFGVTKGAYTGADRDRPGLILEADGGTFFFDEASEMSKAMQAKLLRVLERQEVLPVGGVRPRRVDVRTVFASNVDLPSAVNLGRFRQDLYFRIAQISVEIPPLRERIDDLPLLLRDILSDLRRPEVRVDKSALALLAGRPWSGNVRELANVVQAALPAVTGVLSASILQEALLATRTANESGAAARSYELARTQFDRGYYAELHTKHAGNVSRIAEEIGRERATVRRTLDRLGLRPIGERPGARGGAEAHRRRKVR